MAVLCQEGFWDKTRTNCMYEVMMAEHTLHVSGRVMLEWICVVMWFGGLGVTLKQRNDIDLMFSQSFFSELMFRCSLYVGRTFSQCRSQLSDLHLLEEGSLSSSLGSSGLQCELCGINKSK